MKTNEALQLNSYTVLNHKEYTAYRLYKRIPKTFKVKRPEYNKFVKTYLTVMKEELLNREGGVCIKGFGYWFMWLIPKKLIYKFYTKQGQVSIPSPVTNSHIYTPTFIGVNTIQWWSMDKSFAKDFRYKLKRLIKSGKVYKMYLHSLRQLKYI